MNLPSQRTTYRWQPTTWLHVSGADTFTFLQGQFTNDLRDIAKGSAVYGLWLNVKGKVLADSFVLAGETKDAYWIGSYSSAREVLKERLESYIIADDVVIDDQSEQWSGLTVFGEDAEQQLVAVRTALATSSAQPLHVFRSRRGIGWDWVFPTVAEKTVLAALGHAHEISPDEAKKRRIEAGMPAIPAEVGANDLPNEAGLDEVAISYTKGCYLGQEVMARLKNLGQVRRRLLRVAGNRPNSPALPAPLFASGRQVGELRSLAATESGAIGFAMITLMHVQPQSGLSFDKDAAPSLHILDPL